MIEFKAANAASHKISATSTATALFTLMDTAGSVTTNAGLLGGGDSFSISVEASGGVRVLMDGNTPTSAAGLFLPQGMYKFVGRDLAKVSIIRAGGTDVACSVSTGDSTISEQDDYSVQASGGGATAFTGLTDTPASYAAQALKTVRVNAGATALEFSTAGAGDVTKVGTPVDSQVGVWTGDGTIEGDTALTFDTTTDTLSSGGFLDTSLTASEIIITDGSKNLASAAVATYPSLTELAYVKGVTSAVQTQLTSKMDDLVDDTTPTLGGELDCAANSIGFTAQTATGDGTTTIDWGIGNKFNFTFGAFNETFTFTAPTKPGNFLLKMVQDATGSRTATWPATVKWPAGTAPTLTTGANTIDVVSFYYDGTNYYGNSSLAFA